MVRSRQKVHTEGHQWTDKLAVMESEEQIYVNIEELQREKHKRYRPEETETKSVRTDVAAGKQTETSPLFKVCMVGLGLLCFLLLTTAIGVGVLYNQLSRDLANHTAGKHELLVQYQNLTDERDQLQMSFKHAKLELSNLTKTVGKCPDGWKRFGCSCYLFLTSVMSWSNSRQTCQDHGADLVFINSKREMMFLNEFKARSKFWIGLSQSSNQFGGSWKWADGSSLKTAYWRDGYPEISYHRRTQFQRCAAFNSFAGGFYMWVIKSWTSESCTQSLPSVCKKEADMSVMSW